jgi:hypothetical protein
MVARSRRRRWRHRDLDAPTSPRMVGACPPIVRAAMASVVLASMLARTAGGQECAPIQGGSPALASIDAGTRLQFIAGGLERGAHRARVWSWGWGTAYATLTAGQLVATAFLDADRRRDFYVGAVGSTVGVLALAILPLKVIGDEKRLRRRLAAARETDDRCALLAYAEQLLVRDAASETFGQSALVRGGNVLFNLGLGAIIAFWFRHWENAALNTAIGIVIGEIQIQLQPTDVVDLLRRYRAGDLGATAPRARPRPLPTLVPAPIASGVGLGMSLPF